MLTRNTTLTHPSGQRIETPLLVPSFSSKGVGTSSDGRSEIADIMKLAQEFGLAESMLISAYDIHHGFIEKPTSALTDICYVDSGGYETSDLQDLSSTFVQKVERKDWDESKLFAVLDDWPQQIPAVFVSYDDARASVRLDAQIDRARVMRARYHKQLTALLLKPETATQRFVQMKEVISRTGELAGIPILGVTEKELDSSFIDRMVRVAQLRLALDAEGLTAVPIHIFGSLDPISVCLYYIAGAEIFDGLTWIRYGYHEGMASYFNNVAVRMSQLHKRDGLARADSLRRNLDALAHLTIQMKKCHLDENLAHLDPSNTWLQSAYDQLRTKVKGA